MLNEYGEQKEVLNIGMHSQRGRWERGNRVCRTVRYRILFGIC
jgi:hypothetical protein